MAVIDVDTNVLLNDLSLGWQVTVHSGTDEMSLIRGKVSVGGLGTYDTRRISLNQYNTTVGLLQSISCNPITGEYVFKGVPANIGPFEIIAWGNGVHKTEIIGPVHVDTLRADFSGWPFFSIYNYIGDIAYTYGYHTIKANETDSFWKTTRSTRKLSGKVYWEITNNLSGAGEFTAVGIAQDIPNSQTLFVGNYANSVGFMGSDNTLYIDAASSGDYTNLNIGNNTWKFAFDSATGKFWAGTIADGWYNSGDPEAGTGQITTVAAGDYYVCASVKTLENPLTIRDGNYTLHGITYTLAGSVPTGFTAYGP